MGLSNGAVKVHIFRHHASDQMEYYAVFVDGEDSLHLAVSLSGAMKCVYENPQLSGRAIDLLIDPPKKYKKFNDSGSLSDGEKEELKKLLISVALK